VAAAGPTAQVHPSMHSCDCTDRREGAQVVLPGGRDFGQKAEKGPRKHKVCRKEFVAELWPNFGRILPKEAQKRRKKIY
jgi:hypothetical protein